MLTEPQKLWVDALRSGEYEQGQGALCISGRYCCLGVACELYIKHVDSDFPREDAGRLISYDNLYTQLLPLPVMDWLQMCTANGAPACGERYSLVWHNDHGATFEEIADFIASEPEGLFVSSIEVNHVD